MEENQSNIQEKKSWQEKKIEREFASTKDKKKRTVKKIFYWILVLAAVLSLGWWYVGSASPKGPDYSESVLILGRNHITDGTIVSSYNSNPPTSGPHYAQPANAEFYNSELPDEMVVHNLEHGNVWIAYRPDLPKEIIDTIKGFAGGMVIVTPRFLNDKDIALVAWGRLDKFDLEDSSIDTQRIRDFILRYQNKGPEKVTTSSQVR